MNLREFFKPTALKILIFAFVGIAYLYFASVSVSAAGFGFAFFYNEYGFPFQYLITGNRSNLSGLTHEMFLGNYFAKYGSVLLNPAALALDAALIYLLACMMSILFAKMKPIAKNS